MIAKRLSFTKQETPFTPALRPRHARLLTGLVAAGLLGIYTGMALAEDPSASTGEYPVEEGVSPPSEGGGVEEEGIVIEGGVSVPGEEPLYTIYSPDTSAGALTGVTGIDDLPGEHPSNIGARLTAISDDGQVAVGLVRLDPYNYNAYTFTDGGWTLLAGPEGYGDVEAWGTSADGRVVVGTATNYASPKSRALVWTDGVLSELPDLNTTPSEYLPASSLAQAVSDDGSVVAGASVIASGGWHAVRWVEGAAPQDLTIGSPFGSSFSSDIDATGDTVVGLAATEIYEYQGSDLVPTGGYVEEAFRWTAETGMVGLGVLAAHEGLDGRSWATGVSADGGVVVGQSRGAGDSGEAFRWTADGGMVGLGFLPGGNFSDAADVNADGTVVVGDSTMPVPDYPGILGVYAYRWNDAGGMEYLGDWLTANGVDIGDNEFTHAYGVSADGNTIIGSGQINGYTQPYIARVAGNGGDPCVDDPTGAGCPGDGGGDGGEDPGTGSTWWYDNIFALGDLNPSVYPGANNSAYAVIIDLSTDGTVAVGNITDSTTTAYRFTANGAEALLRSGSATNMTFAAGTSATGDVVVGWEYLPGDVLEGGDRGYRAIRWDAEGQAQILPDLVAGNSEATAVSDDGAVIVGASGGHVARWVDGEVQDLGLLHEDVGTAARALDVSANGSVVVGYSSSADPALTTEAFRWTAETGMVGLGALPDPLFWFSSANAVSRDGSTVVGESGGYAPTRAFRWTEGGGMEGLGLLAGGTYSIANDVNASGSVVVGDADIGDAPTAFRWTADGMLSVADWLNNAGVAVGDNQFYTALSVDGTGDVVAGRGHINGIDQPYIVRVSPPMDGGGTCTIDSEGNITCVDDGGVFVPQDPACVQTDSGEILCTQEGEPGEQPPIYHTMGDGDPRENGFIGLYTTEASIRSSIQALSGAFDLGGRVASLALFGAHHRVLADNGLGEGNCFWATGDIASHGDSDSHQQMGEVGACTDIGNLRVGLGLGLSSSDQDLIFGGSAEYDGKHAMVELDYRIPQGPVASLAGFFGQWDADLLRRDGSPSAYAASTDAEVWAVRARLDWLDLVNTGGFTLSPFAAYTFGNTQTDGYAETGGPGRLVVSAGDHDSQELRVGITAKTPLSPAADLRLSLEGAHRFDDRTAGVSATSPVFGLNLPAQATDVQENWGRVGAEIDWRIGTGSLISASVNAASSGEDPDVSGSLSYRVNF